MPSIFSVAALAATITTVNAMGSAIVQNNCGFPIYLWPVDAQRNPSTSITVAAGGQYSEQYHTPSSGGVSIKLSTTNSLASKVTQFEYTVQSYASNPFLWYDGSNVDCTGAECPFYNYGINLKASDSSCPTRDCPVGQVCSGFYTLWNDDINTLSCNQDANVIMTLCSVSSGGSGNSGSQYNAAASSVAPSKAAVTNEAVATTFRTEYTAPAKRAAEPVHHGHMHFHQRAQE